MKKKNWLLFLTIFLPTREEGEISAFTHPDYRRQNNFKKLFKEAGEVLKENDVPKVLFVTEPESYTSKEVLKKLVKQN